MTADPLPQLTPRLRLRRLAAPDLPAFQAYRGDAEVGRYQGWQAGGDAEALVFLQTMAESAFCPLGAWFQLAIAERESDTLIGDIGLHLHQAQGLVAEIGFTLARGAQGRGLGAEAVSATIRLVLAHTAAERVLAITDTRNTASLRLLESVGLRRYTTQQAPFRGEPCLEHGYLLHRAARPVPRLRAAVAGDAAAVAQVLIESRRQLMPFAPSAHSDEETRDWVARTLLPSGAVTVAQVDGAVVGVLALSERNGLAWIDQLCVLPAQAARGLGRALLDHALALCGAAAGRSGAATPQPLQLYTFQANHHARAFYERHGWRAIAFSDGAANEEHCPDVLYRLGA